jgi:serine protease Do
VPDLIERGAYSHPYLGVSMDTVTRLEAQNEGLPDKGAIVRKTTQGDPADSGGIQAGDIIKEINGTPIGTHDDVISYLEFNTEPGDVVTFTLVDPNGDVRDVEVELGARASR